MPKLIDLTGQRFGRLTVLAPSDDYIVLRHNDDGTVRYRKTYTMVRCRCDCGTECVVFKHQLRSGATKSCGCLRAEKSGERMREVGRRNRKS